MFQHPTEFDRKLPTFDAAPGGSTGPRRKVRAQESANAQVYENPLGPRNSTTDYTFNKWIFSATFTKSSTASCNTQKPQNLSHNTDEPNVNPQNDQRPLTSQRRRKSSPTEHSTILQNDTFIPRIPAQQQVHATAESSQDLA